MVVFTVPRGIWQAAAISEWDSPLKKARETSWRACGDRLPAEAVCDARAGTLPPRAVFQLEHVRLGRIQIRELV